MPYVPSDTELQRMTMGQLEKLRSKFGPYDVNDGAIRLAKEIRYRNRDKIAAQRAANGPSLRMTMSLT